MSEAVTDIRPEHKVVLIKIPRSAPVGADADALLEATSKWWVVAESRRNKGPAGPDFALAVNKGRVVAAYRIAGWRPAPTGHRWGFTGALSDELTALYGGVDVTRYFPPGAANPLRYVNCDTPKASAQRATAEFVELQRTELAEVVRRLDREPLTHLMLGHRELFHSNLLAWFFRSLPESADHVFGSLTSVTTAPSGNTRRVLREKNSLDLWFRWPQRRALVIENKVFSLPDEKQLEGYATKAASRGEAPLFWLLSLSDPSWTDNRKILAGHEWRWLSYRDLAERIADDQHQTGIASRHGMADPVAIARVEEQHLVCLGDGLVTPQVAHIGAPIRKHQLRGARVLFRTRVPEAALAVHVPDCDGRSLQERLNRKLRHGVLL